MVILENYSALIRKRIKEKFKTIENFSKHIGIPRTTINFILKKGIVYSNYGMVKNILKELDIYSLEDNLLALDENSLNLLKRYQALDEMGRHAVDSIVVTESRRMKEESIKDAVTAAYGGLSKSQPLTEEEKLIFELVQKIKENEEEK